MLASHEADDPDAAGVRLAIADALAGPGWLVCPSFISANIAATLALEAQAFWRGNGFRQAQVGAGAQRTLRADVRRDHVMWLDADTASPALCRYLGQIEALRGTLNETLYLSLQRFETHYAAYAPGGFYRRHLDQFQSARHRIVSCVLYLNPDWTAADEGALRLFAPDGAGHHDVMPEAGTLVVFRSDLIEHEVLPTQRLRFSLSGWLRLRDTLD